MGCVHTGVCMYRCVYVQGCVQGCVCTGVCVYRGMCVQGCVCTGVCVYRGVCVQGCVCTGVCVYRGVYVQGCVCTGVCTGVCMYRGVCVQGCIQGWWVVGHRVSTSHTHTHTHSYTHLHPHPHTHTNPQTHKPNPPCIQPPLPINSKKRHSFPLRVTFSTTLRENAAFGIQNISRSKLRMVVLYHPTSTTMPSITCPLLGRNKISSPTCVFGGCVWWMCVVDVCGCGGCEVDCIKHTRVLSNNVDM